MEKPLTTLFLLISVDGKISSGATDERDVAKDYKNISGIKEGLPQYYALEKETDRFSLNTGRVMAKIGVNTPSNPIHCQDMTFVIIDGVHLNTAGVENLCYNLEKLILVTANKEHPAFRVENKNLEIILYENEIDLIDLFKKLRVEHGIEALTIQSGGTLNTALVRAGLIDRLSLVVAPCLVGGKDTSSMLDGWNILSDEDLKHIKPLKLIEAKVLENSYLHLIYSL